MNSTCTIDGISTIIAPRLIARYFHVSIRNTSVFLYASTGKNPMQSGSVFTQKPDF